MSANTRWYNCSFSSNRQLTAFCFTVFGQTFFLFFFAEKQKKNEIGKFRRIDKNHFTQEKRLRLFKGHRYKKRTGNVPVLTSAPLWFQSTTASLIKKYHTFKVQLAVIASSKFSKASRKQQSVRQTEIQIFLRRKIFLLKDPKQNFFIFDHKQCVFF